MTNASVIEKTKNKLHIAKDKLKKAKDALKQAELHLVAAQSNLADKRADVEAESRIVKMLEGLLLEDNDAMPQADNGGQSFLTPPPPQTAKRDPDYNVLMSNVCSLVNGHVATPDEMARRFRKKGFNTFSPSDFAALFDYWRCSEHKIPDGIKVQKSQHWERRGVWGVIKDGMTKESYRKRATTPEYCAEVVKTLEKLEVYGEDKKVMLTVVSSLISEDHKDWAEGRRYGVHSSISSIATRVATGEMKVEEAGFCVGKQGRNQCVWLPTVRWVPKEA